MSISSTELASIIERVIEGAPWLDFPKTVQAPSPFDPKQLVDLRIDPTAAHSDFRLNLRQTAFDLWANVIGVAPPVPGAAHQLSLAPDVKLVGIKNAHACYLGVNRPVGEDDLGDNMLAYVVKPRNCFAYESSMSGVAKLCKLPPDVVFVIYVRLDSTYREGESGCSGVVSHWSLVETDASDPRQPRDFARRFTRRLW